MAWRSGALFLSASAAVCGCAAILGREDLVIEADAPDAAVVEASSDAPVDAVVDERPSQCAWDSPFLSATRLEALVEPAASESSITFAPDEKTALIVRKLPAEGARVFATSLLADGGFTSATPVSIEGFNPASNCPVTMGLAPSGERLYLSFFTINTTPPPPPEWDIFVAERSTDGGFLAPVRMSNAVNTPTIESDPSPAGDELFFASDYPPEDGGPRRVALYSAPLDGGPRVRVKSIGDGGLDGPGGHDSHPVLSRDRLTLFYASRASGVFDVYVTHRASVADPFEPPMLVTSLSALNHEAPLYVSNDGCRLYLVRDDADGNARLWVASREPTLP